MEGQFLLLGCALEEGVGFKQKEEGTDGAKQRAVRCTGTQGTGHSLV